MDPTAAKMTYDQLRLLPEDRNQYELFDGELVMTPSPSSRHQQTPHVTITSMKSAATKMTYAQLCLLPEDRKRHELIDGEHFVTPAPNPKHQEIVGELYSLLSAYVKANALGKVYIAPVDVVFEEHTVLEPDILFISQARRGIVGEDAIHGAPELVVEVLSPSTFYHDLRRKMTAYSQFGVQEYWIVDPEKRTIELHQRVGEGLQLVRQFASHETFRSTLLPGLQLDVHTIF